jgi:hypothetical protein
LRPLGAADGLPDWPAQENGIWIRGLRAYLEP